MSQKQLTLLNTPARKFFIRQLLSCSLQHNGGIIHPNLYGKEITTQVWIQGVVVLVSSDRNDLVLDDGTGVIHVTGFTKILKDLYLHKGKLKCLILVIDQSGMKGDKKITTIKMNLLQPLCSVLWHLLQAKIRNRGLVLKFKQL